MIRTVKYRMMAMMGAAICAASTGCTQQAAQTPATQSATNSSSSALPSRTTANTASTNPKDAGVPTLSGGPLGTTSFKGVVTVEEPRTGARITATVESPSGVFISFPKDVGGGWTAVGADYSRFSGRATFLTRDPLRLGSPVLGIVYGYPRDSTACKILEENRLRRLIGDGAYCIYGGYSWGDPIPLKEGMTGSQGVLRSTNLPQAEVPELLRSLNAPAFAYLRISSSNNGSGQEWRPVDASCPVKQRNGETSFVTTYVIRSSQVAAWECSQFEDST